MLAMLASDCLMLNVMPSDMASLDLFRIVLKVSLDSGERGMPGMANMVCVTVWQGIGDCEKHDHPQVDLASPCSREHCTPSEQ